MPPRRNASKSTYSTEASSTGRRAIKLAGVISAGRFRRAVTNQNTPSAKMAQLTITTRPHLRRVTERVSNRRGEFADARFLPQADVRLKLVHHGLETGQGQRLRAIAYGFLGIGVHFNDEAVGAH